MELRKSLPSLLNQRPLFFLILGISAFSIIPLFTIILNSTLINLNFEAINIIEFSHYLKNSLYILFFVLILTFFFGVFSAYLISFFKFPGVGFFKYALILSFAIPPYIFGYSISAFFENFGTAYSILNSISNTEVSNSSLLRLSPHTNTIISLSFTLYGYVYLLTSTSFLNQSNNF